VEVQVFLYHFFTLSSLENAVEKANARDRRGRKFLSQFSLYQFPNTKPETPDQIFLLACFDGLATISTENRLDGWTQAAEKGPLGGVRGATPPRG
jgi:hypothetical protein